MQMKYKERSNTLRDVNKQELSILNIIEIIDHLWSNYFVL